MSREEVSQRLAQLLEELAEGEVHCVVLAATTGNENKSIAFGMEMNTKKAVAAALLQAGIKRLDGTPTSDALRGDIGASRPRH